jgi:hypothetical protein
MRILFLTASGHALSDKVGLNYDNIQEPDGVHPMGNEAVYRDVNKTDAIMFIPAKMTVALGDSRSKGRMEEIVFERTVMMVARRGQKVSRIWSRRLINGSYFVARFIYLSWFMAVMTLGIYILIRLVTL